MFVCGRARAHSQSEAALNMYTQTWEIAERWQCYLKNVAFIWRLELRGLAASIDWSCDCFRSKTTNQSSVYIEYTHGWAQWPMIENDQNSATYNSAFPVPSLGRYLNLWQPFFVRLNETTEKAVQHTALSKIKSLASHLAKVESIFLHFLPAFQLWKKPRWHHYAVKMISKPVN